MCWPLGTTHTEGIKRLLIHHYLAKVVKYLQESSRREDCYQFLQGRMDILPSNYLVFKLRIRAGHHLSTMREDVAFNTGDGVTLRGWFYKPAVNTNLRVPCLVMSNGFAAVKEMSLDAFAGCFTSRLPLNCLVFDNRGFGASGPREGRLRQEIVPAVQNSDISDAITYAQSREDVDPDKIGIWGTSFSGGNVLWVGAADRRVKAVLSQVPLIDGWQNYHWLVKGATLDETERRLQEGMVVSTHSTPLSVLFDLTRQ